MNNTKIEWCDATWNPVTGCLHGCKYCYARRIAERFGGNSATNTSYACRPFNDGHALYELGKPAKKYDKSGKLAIAPFPCVFEPTFHRYRLEEPQTWKKPQTVFVCSMADLFGEWVPDTWIEEVFSACEKAPQHRYLFLTKNPQRYIHLATDGLLPKSGNMWYGSTITDPDTSFFVAEDFNTFLSIEPLLEPFNAERSDSLTALCAPKWIIIGAMTGPGSREKQPKREWVENIVKAARWANTPVFMKDSMVPIMGDSSMVREFPWGKEGD